MQAGERSKVDQFALVIYVPSPLKELLDGLREDLVPNCRLHAHVSVLPPRPLAASTRLAAEQARGTSREFAPFEIGLGEVRVFPGTRVVYIEVEEGRNQLRGMHQSLNREAFHFVEEYQYHPHLTLAQDFPEAELRRIEELAKQRWREFRGPRRFRAGELVFVQNRNGQGWADLETISMGQVPAK